jgi:hypothetical protein
MRPEADDTMEQAAEPPLNIDSAAVERVSGIVLPTAKPARALPRWWMVALTLQVIFLGVAILGATRMGLNGVRVLNGAGSSLIFGLLGALGLVAALTVAAELAPGVKIKFDSKIIVAACTGAFVAVFVLLFHDFRMDRFASEGIDCLGTGLLHAAVTGLLLWLVIRRGVIFDPMAAGLAAGTLAGLAGFGVLEMHCPILKAMHLMVWHIAIIPLSSLAGCLAVRSAQALGAKRKLAEFMQ